MESPASNQIAGIKRQRQQPIAKDSCPHGANRLLLGNNTPSWEDVAQLIGIIEAFPAEYKRFQDETQVALDDLDEVISLDGFFDKNSQLYQHDIQILKKRDAKRATKSETTEECTLTQAQTGYWDAPLDLEQIRDYALNSASWLDGEIESRWYCNWAINCLLLSMLPKLPGHPYVCLTSFFDSFRGHPNQKRFVSKAIQNTKDGFIVPIFFKDHWTCALFYQKEKRIYLLDSNGGEPDPMEQTHLLNLSQIVWKVKKDIVTVQHIPYQQNGYDCGVFMLEYIARAYKDVDRFVAVIKTKLGENMFCPETISTRRQQHDVFLRKVLGLDKTDGAKLKLSVVEIQKQVMNF